ncbi:hypothetical protein ACNKHS_17355 [Shigella flexneri]
MHGVYKPGNVVLTRPSCVILRNTCLRNTTCPQQPQLVFHGGSGSSARKSKIRKLRRSENEHHTDTQWATWDGS